MAAKPVVPRVRALHDVEEAIDHYLAEAGASVALQFVDALQDAYTHMGKHPATGSPRYAHALNLPGLRHWRLRGFPHLVFFIDRADHVDVWRLLHGARDMPASLLGPEPHEV